MIIFSKNQALSVAYLAGKMILFETEKNLFSKSNKDLLTKSKNQPLCPQEVLRGNHINNS